MSMQSTASRPDVSIVIPVFNKLELTKICIKSICEVGAEATFEVLVVDNGSTDGSAEWLAEQEGLGRLKLIINPENLGFSRGCNVGAAAAQGKYILFLNNDMQVLEGWLDPMVSTLDRDPEVGIVGAKLLFADNTIQHAGVALIQAASPDGKIAGNHMVYQKPANHPGTSHPIYCQVVTGACLLIRQELFQDIGCFEEEYWNGNEDVDLCLKARQKGWQTVMRPESLIYHFESQSGKERWIKADQNIELLTKRWQGVAKPDFILDAQEELQATADLAIRTYTPPRLGWRDAAIKSVDEPIVSVIVLTWNALEYTRACADSLLEHTDPRHELIFVDNGSENDTIEYLKQLEQDHRQVKAIFNGQNLGFAAGNNVGMVAGQGEYYCLLNSDAVVTAGWLDALLAPAENDEKIGLVGPVTNSISGGQKLPAVDYNENTLEGLADFAARRRTEFAGQHQAALMVVGFCLLIRKSLVTRIGGLDEGFGQGNYEDTDFCLRSLLAGFNATVVLDSFVHHFGSRSFVAGKVDYSNQIQEKFEIFRRKWHLDSNAQSTANLNLDQLLKLGYIEPLHYCPLPVGTKLQEYSLGDWEEKIWLTKGEAFFSNGRLDEAERIFRALLRVRPSSTRGANNLACTLWQKQEGAHQDEAVAILEKVLQTDPANEDALYNLQEMTAAQS